jgi:cephalosporin-C deacetylase-like acetyl esterase
MLWSKQGGGTTRDEFQGRFKMRNIPKIRSPHRAAMALVAGLTMFGGSVLAQSPGGTHFSYDRGASLNVKQVSIKVRNGVTVEDITYTGSNGDTVPAYLVIPKGAGKFAGIVWGHWMMDGAANANRSEFLDEAIALAPAGAVSLLIDAPQIRPDFKSVPGVWAGPGPEPAVYAQQVVDFRRGLDLLLSRPDVDASRIAYVGHSFDAQIGAILDATDKRFSTFVFMGGPNSMLEWVVSSDSPLMVPFRQKADMAKVEQNLKTNAWAFPESYADKLGPAPALFQYGLHDDAFVPLAVAKDYAAAASGPKTVKFYDADHALNAEARTDRDGFLSKMLGLKL